MTIVSVTRAGLVALVDYSAGRPLLPVVNNRNFVMPGAVITWTRRLCWQDALFCVSKISDARSDPNPLFLAPAYARA